MAKYKIIGQRYLRKYTAARSTPVYSARIDVETIVDSLCNVPWERVSPKEAGMTYHTDEPVGDDKISGLDMNVKIRDGFDAALFCAGHTGGQHRAYANAAAYVYELPSELVGLSLKSITLNVTSDPYNSNGARIHMLTTQLPELPTSCRICRGEDESGSVITDGTTLSAVAKRTSQTINGTEYWYPTSEDCTLSPSGGLILQKYLVVFVLMENYATVRGNWIEGCSFIRNLAEIEVDGDVAGWTEGETYDLTVISANREFNVCRNGVLPLLASQITGLKTVTIQKTGDELIASRLLGGGTNAGNALCKLDASLASVVAELDGPVTSIDVMQPNGIRYTSGSKFYWTAVQFAVITGTFSKGSFTGLPGFLLYDVWRGKVLEDIPLTGFDSNLVAAARNGRLRGGFAYATNGDSSSTVVYVWALFETGAFVKNSAVYPFAYFTIAQDSGIVSNPGLESGVTFSPETKCHYIVQSGAEENFMYNMAEELYLDNGKIMRAAGTFTNHFPASGVAYEGTINAIRPLRAMKYGEYRFIVSGKLTSVGGKACKNCAIITFTTSDATVTVPAFDEIITPDTYESFSVSHQLSCLTANSGGTYSWNWGEDGNYLVSGAFSALDGDTTFRKAVDVIGGQRSTRTALADISRVIGAVPVYGGQIIYAQGSQKSGGLEVFDVADLHTDVAAAESAIGLRTLYAKLYTNKLYSISQSVVGSKERIGAGFVVKTGAVAVNALNGSTYSEVTVPTWQLTLASLVVPFSVPQDFRATGIRLDWTKLTATGGKLNVWLKRDSYVSEMPDLSDASFYLADRPAIDGWELLGTIDSGETSSSFALEALAGYCASLLFTAYISLDDLNPSDAMTMPQGVATALDVNSITGDVAGLDTTWKPDITLIG